MTTPTCPACGAHFSHNSTLLWCNKCHLPDEVAHSGPKAIERWKLQQIKESNPAAERFKFGGSAGRRRNKHGRVGIRR